MFIALSCTHSHAAWTQLSEVLQLSIIPWNKVQRNPHRTFKCAAHLDIHVRVVFACFETCHRHVLKLVSGVQGGSWCQPGINMNIWSLTSSHSVIDVECVHGLFVSTPAHAARTQLPKTFQFPTSPHQTCIDSFNLQPGSTSMFVLLCMFFFVFCFCFSGKRRQGRARRKACHRRRESATREARGEVRSEMDRSLPTGVHGSVAVCTNRSWKNNRGVSKKTIVKHLIQGGKTLHVFGICSEFGFLTKRECNRRIRRYQ